MVAIAETFSPETAAAGGILIGIGSAILLRTTGRIMGYSGIIRNMANSPWRQATLGGMLTTGGLGALVLGDSWFVGVHQLASVSPAVPVLSGLLVGFGSTMGSGCTSGHGICGLARFSKRSMVAVPTFMGSAAVTAYSLRHIDPMLVNSNFFSSLPAVSPTIGAMFATGLGAAMVANAVLKKPIKSAEDKELPDTVSSNLACALSGSIFSSGLILSHMCDPNKVLGFIDPLSPAGWDPSLAFTMGGALLITIPAFNLGVPKAPILRPTFQLPPVTNPVTARLVAGSTLFGVGWGICGMCPAPAVVDLASGAPAVGMFVASMYVGMKMANAAGF